MTQSHHHADITSRYHTMSLIIQWSINFAIFTQELGCSPGALLIFLPTLVDPSFHPFLLLSLVLKDLFLADEAVSQLHQVGLSPQGWKNNVKGHVGSSYIRINPGVVA